MPAPRPSKPARPAPPGPVDALVAELLDSDPALLDSRLDELCEQHPEEAPVLRRRVKVLVDAGLIESTPVELPEELGEFRLLEPIGEGGMGVVYRAEQRSLEREVAIKLIRPGELRFPAARERFAREVATVARLSHPGIVPIYAVGDEGGVPYFAMELVRGETLANLLTLVGERARRADETLVGSDLDRALAAALGEEPADEPAELFRGTWEATALRIVQAVAAALEHAHATSVLHRDVKPSNIMLTRDGRVMLLDFGLSSLEGSERLTRTGIQVGSFAYMAPELLTGEGVADRRSDVYSLGVTLYELLVGKLPFEAKSLASLRSMVMHRSPRSLRKQLEPGRRVSWEAETVCLSAMDVDRMRRYSSAGELARDVENVLAGRPIEARRPGLVLRARRFATRHPAWTMAVALTALAVPVTWAVSERTARVRLGAAKAATDRANVALEASLAEVRRQEARADANFVLAREAVDRMLDRLGDVRLRDVPHMQTLRRDVLKDALAFHESLVEAKPQDAEQRLEYVRALRRTADMHALLSEFDEVSEKLNRAKVILESELVDAKDERFLEELGQVAWRLVEAEGFRGQLTKAIELGRAVRERLAAAGLDGPQPRLRVARLDLQIARVLQRAGRADEGHAVLLRSVEELRDLRAQEQLFADGPNLLAEALGSLGEPDVYMVFGDGNADEHAQRTDYLREALELRRSIATKAPTPDNRFAVMEALNSLAGALFSSGEPAQAFPVYVEARTIVEQLVDDFPSVNVYRDARAATYLNLGTQHAALGDYEAAHDSYTQAEEAYADIHQASPNQRGLGVRRLIALHGRIDSAVSLGQFSDALLTKLDETEQLMQQLAQVETGQGAAFVARLRPRFPLLRASVLIGLERANAAAELARRLKARSQPEPLFQAAAVLTLVAAAPDRSATQASVDRSEAVECISTALDQQPPAALIERWVGSKILKPLHNEPDFANLIEFWGLTETLAN